MNVNATPSLSKDHPLWTALELAVPAIERSTVKEIVGVGWKGNGQEGEVGAIVKMNDSFAALKFDYNGSWNSVSDVKSVQVNTLDEAEKFIGERLPVPEGA